MLAGLKGCVYVEIGCWAGASAEWTARNILSAPDSIGFGLDPYLPDRARHPVDAIEQRAHSRLAFMGARWQWIKAPSAEALRTLSGRISELRSDGKAKIDLLYIDGSHSANDVVIDFALAWPMLAPSSIVIFDDYRRRRRNTFPNVDTAVHAIESAWGRLLKPIGQRRFQAAFQVVGKSFE